MTKDPAFLFYPNDYIGGTMGMTFEEKGAYMELLMMQFNRGHMTTHMIGQTVGQVWDKIKDKFVQDENGMYYNKRLELEIDRRKTFVESRKNNISGVNQYTKKRGHMGGHTTKHTSSHMENVDVNINKDNITTDTVSNNSSSIYEAELPTIYKAIEMELHIQLTPSMISFVSDMYDFGIIKSGFIYAASETAKAGAPFKYFETTVKNLLAADVKSDEALVKYQAEFEKKKQQSKQRAAPEEEPRPNPRELKKAEGTL